MIVQASGAVQTCAPGEGALPGLLGAPPVLPEPAGRFEREHLEFVLLQDEGEPLNVDRFLQELQEIRAPVADASVPAPVLPGVVDGGFEADLEAGVAGQGFPEVRIGLGQVACSRRALQTLPDAG